MPELKANFRMLCLRVLLVASVLLSQAALHGSSQSTSAEAREDRGLELAHAGDLAGAESELRAALALAPNNAEFLANLATVLAMENKLDESTTSFEHALKLDPSNLTTRRYLAANLWQMHRYTEARKNLQLILKQKPDDAPSQLLLGMVAENMKDYRMAVRMLSSVPAELRKQPESIGALAISYYNLGENEKAQNTLGLLKSHPAGPRAVLLGAQIADEMADYVTAEQLLNSIKSAYSDEEDLGYRLATVHYHAGRFENCEQTLLPLVTSRAATGQMFNLLGWCYQKQNRLDDAIRVFENGTKVQPSEESNYLDLEYVFLANNRIPAALELAKKATDALPSSTRAVAMRGSIEMKAGQFSDAVRSYRRAKELDPASADAALGLADADYSAGIKEDAQNTFTAGIQRFPKDARFPLHYALMLLKETETGDQTLEKEVQELLKSAVKLDPTLLEAHYQLAELAMQNGDTTDALREYETAAKLDPLSAKPHFGLAKVYRRLGRAAEASQETELFQKLQQKNSQSATAPSSTGASKN
jgi:tetratricopeptide (TPR) repeat protein